MPQPIADDLVQPFQIERSSLRGRLVRLGPLVDTILAQHAYPDAVAAMLGEAIVLAVTLAGALKYEGVFTLQTKGDGPLHLMIVDVTTAGAVRGYAQYDGDKLAQGQNGVAPAGAVPRLLGAGYIAFTVDQGEYTDRYQGIVELQGATLAECAHHYFHQSEQVQAGITIAVGKDPAAAAWRAGGLMLQRLPQDGENGFLSDAQEDGWRRAMVLMSSSTNAELLDPALAPNDLLYRLFHEDGVRVFPPHALQARCRCSRERVERILIAMPQEDTVEETVEVTCEFCNRRFAFRRDEIGGERRPGAAAAGRGA